MPSGPDVLVEPTAAQRIRKQAKDATRQALLEAGLAETIDLGGSLPSIESLCKRAGYTRGAFYVHFKDREDFVAELLDWILTDIIEVLFVPIDADDLSEVVDRFTTTLEADRWPDVGGNIRAVYLAVLKELKPGNPVADRHARLMQGIRERLGSLIAQGQRSGHLRPDVEAGDAASLVLLSAIASIVWNDVGIPMKPRELGRSLLGLLELPESTPPRRSSRSTR